MGSCQWEPSPPDPPLPPPPPGGAVEGGESKSFCEKYPTSPPCKSATKYNCSEVLYGPCEYYTSTYEGSTEKYDWMGNWGISVLDADLWYSADIYWSFTRESTSIFVSETAALTPPQGIGGIPANLTTYLQVTLQTGPNPGDDYIQNYWEYVRYDYLSKYQSR